MFSREESKYGGRRREIDGRGAGGASARAPPERSRRHRPLLSISLLRPPYFDSSRENFPRHLLHLPQPPARLLPAGIAPTAAGHHWSPLEACSTVDLLLRSSSARTDRGNGFVVSSLCSPAFFPFRCAPPAPVNGRRRACCRLLCGVKGYESRTVRLGGRGQSTGQVRSCPETMMSLVVSQIVQRTVRYWRADSPP